MKQALATRPTVTQRAAILQARLGIEQGITMPLFNAPRRIQADQADWWTYPAELDYALWQHGAIPIRAVHWPTVASLAGQFDRLYMAHELAPGAEFTEALATAPASFVQVAKPATFRGVKLAPYAPAAVLPWAMPAASTALAYDPVLFGVITDGRTGVFMPIAAWTWR